ncbi:hypothetical protein L0668_12125 [Paraglaciecola aquimarina]|uniref:Poly(Beta-D-mannuronate) lyase n=1 Tax=Paraglaciecola algarum TaxID=3050085 RepID=A0ABS9D7B5_9ALTE|nr:chondroitinase-B domain-containing protein [Paraglaciecola sp. G1-23]MCF2948858.1 hypothetical protein [Paraglaciecola sp. G1-23]
MYKKIFALSALSLAISACGNSSGDSNSDLVGDLNITGTAEYGSSLTASVVEPDGLTGAVTYTWQRNSETIPGATGKTYEIQKEDLEATIRAHAKYVDDKGFNAVIVSDQSNQVPIVNFEGSVAIDGIAQQGQTLEAIPYDDNKGLDITSATFTWYADGVEIPDQISRKFTVPRDVIGQKLSVTAVYTDRHGFVETVTSGETSEVIKINNTLGMVVLSGDKTEKVLLQVGQTLKANIDDFNEVGTEPTYTWYADNTVIAGENQQTYTLVESDIGKAISAQAVYVDGDGFSEDATSTASESVIARPGGTDNAASIAYSTATPLVNTEIMATVTDADGLPDDVFYQWSINGEVVSNTNAYTPVSADAGKELRLVVDYTDNIGFITVVDEIIDIVFTKVVSNKTELETTINSLEEGDVVGLAPGDYHFPDEAPVHFDITQNNITLSRTAEAVNADDSATNTEKAALSGKFCLSVNNSASGTSYEDGVKLTNLLLTEFDRYLVKGVKCNDVGGSSNAIVVFSADYVTLSHNEFLNDAITGTSPNESHWIYTESTHAHISRNSFNGRNLAKKNLKGGILKFKSLDTPLNHIVEYNYFVNYEIGSSAGVGNSAYIARFGNAGSNSQLVGNITFRYNLLDKVDSRLHILKINSSGAKVYGNTFLDNRGGVILETGENGNVSYNLFIGDNTNDDQGGQSGVAASPHGHTVKNNYIVAINTAGYERGPLILETSSQDSSANSGKNTSTFINNTLVNTKQAIVFSNHRKDKCETWGGELPVYLGALENNLVVSNFDAGEKTNELTSTKFDLGGTGAIREGCFFDTHMKVTFNNEHYYSDTIIGDKKTFLPGAGVIFDAAANAEVAVDEEGFVIYNGADQNVGADPSKLYRIQTSEVGVGSTWEWDILLPGLND